MKTHPYSLFIKRNLLIFFAYIISAPIIADKNLDYRQLTDNNNVMSQSISNIIKDNYGFVWIASRSGISRYDGRNIKHYALSESEIMQDTDGRSFFIRKAYDNRLWAFSNNGKIYCYDPSSDAFILKTDISLHFKLRFMFDLYLDEEGYAWIASTTGLLRCPLDKPSNTHLITDDKTSVTCILPISPQTLALGTTRGLQFVDMPSLKISKPGTQSDKYNIMSLHLDARRNYIWIGSFSSGLFVWDISNRKYVNLSYLANIPSVPIKAIREWGDDCLLIGLDGRGVYKVDIANRTSNQYLSNSDKGGGILKANNVYDIFVDDKNIWVGTYSGGITIVREPNGFDWIKHIPYEEQSIKGSHVYAILEDRDGDVWYATNLGVSFYDTQKRHWTHFLEEENSFLTLCEDNNGYIWTGGYSTGLYCIDKRRGIIRYIASLKGTPQLECVYASAKDMDGDLWFGCLYSTLTRMSVVNGKETLTYYDIEQVKSIKVLDRERLFIASSNGFYILNKQTGKWEHHFTNPAKYGITSNTFIYSSLIIGDDIWFGTDGGGMNCINIKTGKAENFSTYDGLPSNYIYGILEDKHGIFWVSTNNGLFCFDPRTRKFLYNIGDLPMKEFLFMSFTELRDKRMAFGGIDGALIFSPEEIKKAELKAKIIFTDFRLFYQSITAKEYPKVLPKPIDQLSNIDLKYNQSSFSFGFIAIDLYNADNYIYKYKLEGFDKEWITRINTLSADYTNISPGKYTFVIQCINKNDGQLLDERKINIVVNEPFWNTVWAWLIYMLILASLAYWAWSFYRERMLKQQSRERINFFINVAHDIRTPLSLVLAPLTNLEEESKLSEKGRNYLQLAKQNGEKLLTLVSQLLDFQKEELNPSHINLSVCNLNDYLQNKTKRFIPLAQDKKLNICLDMPSESVYIETDIKKLDRIVDNLLSNAIKYSKPDGKIDLRLKTTEKEIRLEVEDYGIGISKKEQKKIFNHIYRARNAINSKEIGSGIGLMLTRKLVTQIKGELTFVSEENKGTTFRLSFPLKELGFVSLHNQDTLSNESPEPDTYLSSKRYYTESYRILLVEDNDDMRNYLSSMLSSEYKLYSVPSAERALEFLKNNMADMVISDVMMEDMQGDELCRILKNNIETSHIQVILLTAITEKDKMINSLGYGADDYITKPFDIQVLKIKIHNILETRKKLQQYYLTKNNLSLISSQQETEEQELATINIDDEFLSKSIQIVVKNLSNTEFTVNDLCSDLAMSRTLVYEKLKALTNQSPNEFIRVIRLKQAKDLLTTHKYTIQEVASISGFSDTKYFSTVFKKYYGISPSQV